MNENTDTPIFYKAVRVNGRDFHTDTVDYASLCGTGQQLPELPGGECCTSGVYHASTSKADTLIGGSWPCRLFEVTGTPVAEEENKRGFRTLTVVRELPAHEALGPNGKAVAELITRVESLAAEQLEALGAARGAAWDAAWDAARGAAWDAAWNAARNAARDATAALVVRDLVTDEQFDLLYGPWASVMEREA